MTDTERVVDFVPDAAGWRILHLSPGGHATFHLAGWLTLEDGGERRVVPGMVEGIEVLPVELVLAGLTWNLLEPGDPDPAPEAIQEWRRIHKAAVGNRS